MGQTHTHAHDLDHSNFYIDQLCAIALCGGLAGVCIALYAWQPQILSLILTPRFHVYVLWGGIALLAFVAVRAVALWRSTEEHTHDHGHHHPEHEHAHGHEHVHGDGEGCCDGHDHDHAHKEGVLVHTHEHAHAAEAGAVTHTHGPGGSHSHEHGVTAPAHAPAAAPLAEGNGNGEPAAAAHDHGHEHGFAPWRYIVLMLPLVFFFLRLPNENFAPTASASPFQKFVYYFTGIFYEALPFIVLGVVLAGLLEELVPQQAIAKIIPRSRALAIAIGGLLGILFPMCECGIIPVMRRLLRKGVPLSVCVCYMLAGPIINVVVMLSTYVAFSGYGHAFGLEMMGLRMGFGFLVAFLVSMVVEWQFQKHGDRLLNPRARADLRHATPAGEDDEPAPPKPLSRRLANISETALHDFVDVTVFLIIGAFLAALTRVVLPRTAMVAMLQQTPALSILIMMGLAILLCICSEADAFVAASFVGVPATAKLGFLVLGPMLDFKLYMMYTRVFRPRLIWTIIVSVVTLVFLSTLAFHYAAVGAGMSQFTVARDVEQGTGHLDLSKEVAKDFIVFAGGPPLNNVVLARVLVGGKAVPIDFKTLEKAGAEKDDRDYWAGQNVKVKGLFMPRRGNDRMFGLGRFKMVCCAADTVPIQVAMFCRESVAGIPDGTWVEVTGQVRFLPAGNDRWMTVLEVAGRKDIQKTRPDFNPYVE